MIGLDVLGAEEGNEFMVYIGGDRALSVTVDPIAVAKSQGALASVLAAALPDTLSDVVYSKMADQLQQGLKDKGVVAVVKVVDAKSVGQVSGSSPEFRGLLVGGIVGVVGALVGKFVWNRVKGRS